MKKEKPADLYKDVCEKSLFTSLYEKYADEIYKFLYYKYGDSLNPSDKTQEAFIKLWENCKKVTLNTARAFLYRVANNSMLNELKHQKVVLLHQKEKPASATNETPEFALESQQYYEQYQKVLSSLSEEQRTAFMLNKVEGKSHAEIAAILGVTKKVVEYRIYSAFNILKSKLSSFKIK